MFITFEGLDCSGKSTQAKLLVERLQSTGREVVFLREPGGTSISEMIRAILLDKKHLELTDRAELFLFSAARTQLVSQIVLPALQRGTVVVCDRFYDSTTAYQGYGRNLDLAEVHAINRIATFGTSPTLTVLVEIEIEEIDRRRRAAGAITDRMEASGRQFYERVRLGYRKLADAAPDRFFVVDGQRPAAEIHNDIWLRVQQRFT